jgi:hypothetical protein
MREHAAERPTDLEFHGDAIDFLDGLVHGLFGLGLKLEYCVALMDDSPDQAKSGIDAAIGNVGQLIEPLRYEIERLSGAFAHNEADGRNDDGQQRNSSNAGRRSRSGAGRSKGPAQPA